MPKGVFKRKPMSPERRAQASDHMRSLRGKRHPYVTDAQYFERFKARTVVNANGCWLWQGFIHQFGYGEVGYRGEGIRAHRAMYLVAKGPIPEGMHVCHTCDIRHCINPDHLWLGTRSDNMRDMHAKYRGPQQTKTHCKHGHPYDAENTYVSKLGHRACNACKRITYRMRAGWTREQAENLPVTPFGYRPVNGNFHRRSETETGDRNAEV